MKRKTKRFLLRIANPLDSLARRVNHKQDQPPLDLRWDVGPLSTFESSGAQYRVYLKLLAGLKPDSRILDIGCGCGQMALEFRDELDERGRYHGFDINKRAIDWCSRHISAKDHRFSFHHINVRNMMYNPGGLIEPKEFTFPAMKEKFDIVLVKSVFTHMLKGEVVNYLGQIIDLLDVGGKCVASFFLLNKKQNELAERGKNLITWQRWNDGSFVHSRDVPEAIVAYEESEVREMLEQAGLMLLHPIEYGSWTGDKTRLSHQDILILGRATPS